MKESGISNTLKIIYDLLPLHAEEGGEAFSVNLRDSLSKVGSDNAEISIALSLVEQLFISLGLLDETLLEHGVWRFKSFPASLMARSVLSSLTDKDQSLFPRGFWGAQSDRSPASEDQRKVLDYLESHRQKHHQASAKPIRYVHVAWGLICVDGKFLLHHREDLNRMNESNYVLVGGKVSQNDLMVADKDLSANDAIKRLQSPEASNCLNGIDVALGREMSEETGLEPETHYNYSHWRTLKPYTNMGGAGAVRAITEYHIHVYHIELTRDGLFELSKRVRRDSNLTWFTQEEMGNAKSQDGKMAYIDALIEDFGSKKEWAEQAKKIESSYDSDLKHTSENMSFTVPAKSCEPIEVGVTGSEYSVKCGLDQDEYDLLLSLSLHAKDSSCQALTEDLELLPYGWVEAVDINLRDILNSLVNKLAESEIPLIEGFNERFFRISTIRDGIFFDPRFFAYTKTKITERKDLLTVKRNGVKTPFLVCDKQSVDRELSESLRAGIIELEHEIDIDPNRVGGFDKAIRRSLSVVQTIGLRRFVRSKGSELHIGPTSEDAKESES
jgi:8-oxo-dGTP pyrophosphatase MutT (NUDIX family)